MEANEHKEIGERYTSALARALQDTRTSLLRKLIDDAPLFNTYEIEVNFDGKE